MQSALERLAAAVRERRAALDLTQEEVNDLGGPSDTTLGRIEAGEPPSPSSSTLRKLDTGLGWEPGSAKRVLDGNGEPTPKRPTEQATQADYESTLAQAHEILTNRASVARMTLSRLEEVARQLATFSTLDLIHEVEARVVMADQERRSLQHQIDAYAEYVDEIRAQPSATEVTQSGAKVSQLGERKPRTRKMMPPGTVYDDELNVRPYAPGMAADDGSKAADRDDGETQPTDQEPGDEFDQDGGE